MEYAGKATRRKQGFIYNIRKYRQLYILLIPGVLFFVVYKYIPMFGLLMAFKDYEPWNGVFAGPWVGFKYFHYLFSGGRFILLLKNTLTISFLKIMFGFPAPIILALLLNEVRSKVFKRTIQTITYLPNFLSWVIIYGIFYNLFNVSYGLVNGLLKYLGHDTIAFLSDPHYFRIMVVSSAIWKDAGFGTIIYLAALAGIDQDQYEAATVDGANRWELMKHITIPGIMPTAAILFLLSLGSVLYQDFQQLVVFLGSNPLLLDVGDVFETNIYRTGLLNGEYSYGTAVGLFQSLVGMALVIFSNRMAKKSGYTGIW